MKGSEIIRDVVVNADAENCFIKWWRRENDFADYELVDAFMQSGIDNLEFDGYELLDMNQMWELLRSRAADHVDITQRAGEKRLLWRHADGSTESRPFNAEALMEIFDAETHGDILM